MLGLLAFRPDTLIEPYRSYYNEDRWFSLVKQFRKDNFELYGLSSTSVFALTLQCGLSVLKTPHCYKKRREDRNPDCPGKLTAATLEASFFVNLAFTYLAALSLSLSLQSAMIC